jgi:DNA-binding response OmpR family regulator
MRAVLRRSNGPRASAAGRADLEMDLASRVVTVGGDAVQLSAKEYDLLVVLAEEPERVSKKEELVRNVWGFRSLGRGRRLRGTVDEAARCARSRSPLPLGSSRLLP